METSYVWQSLLRGDGIVYKKSLDHRLWSYMHASTTHDTGLIREFYHHEIILPSFRKHGRSWREMVVACIALR